MLASRMTFHMCGSRGGQGLRTPPPPEKLQSIGFLSNTGPDPLKNHKVTKPAFNIGPSSARQRNAIIADDGPTLVVFGSNHILKKRKKKLDPSEKTFWIRACSTCVMSTTVGTHNLPSSTGVKPVFSCIDLHQVPKER